MTAANTLLRVEHLAKEYLVGETIMTALWDVSFSVNQGEFVVLLGPSGSGKSTALNIIGGIDVPSVGSVFFQGKDIGNFTESQLVNYRKKSVGFVFQFYNLITNLTALENISFAADLVPHSLEPMLLLEEVGLSEWAGHFPSQLSGGQQQRVAIARALAKNPSLVLCDEPTGALDIHTGIGVLRILRNFNRRYRKTVIIITHNAGIAEMADHIIVIKNGLVAQDYINPSPVEPEEVQW